MKKKQKSWTSLRSIYNRHVCLRAYICMYIQYIIYVHTYVYCIHVFFAYVHFKSSFTLKYIGSLSFLLYKYYDKSNLNVKYFPLHIEFKSVRIDSLQSACSELSHFSPVKLPVLFNRPEKKIP